MLWNTDRAKLGRANIGRAKLYWKIRGNTNHPLHTTINRRQRNEWITEIQECHRLASRQLEEPTQLQRHDTVPWEQLPYECRIDWIREGTEILKQRSLEYIRTQPNDITYYTDGIALLIAPIAQLVSALDFNFERAVEGSILTAGKRLSLKNLNVITRPIN